MNSIDGTRPNFVKKYVIFYMKGVSFEYAMTLDSPEFEIQAGRLFVTGDIVTNSSSDWSAGLRANLAWDEVVQYLVFDSAADFKRRVGGNPGIFGLFGKK